MTIGNIKTKKHPMKRNGISAVVMGFLLSAFVSCGEVIELDKELFTVSISLGKTKSIQMNDGKESQLNYCQVFVFDEESGVLEGASSSESGSCEVTCTRGDKVVSVLVNAPSVSPLTRSDLSNIMLSLTGNNANGLYMYGEHSLRIDRNTSVPVTVARICSRVVIERLVNRLQENPRDLSLDCIYLSNLKTELSADGSVQGDEWTNRLGQRELSADTISDDIGVSVVHGDAYGIEHRYYLFPNSTVKDTYVDQWSPRHSRMVIRTGTAPSYRYYPLTLPVVNAGYSYLVREAVVMSEGCDSPEDALPFTFVSVTSDGVEDYTWKDDGVNAGGGTLIFTDNGLDAMDYVYSTIRPITDECLIVIFSDGTVSPFSFTSEQMHASTDAAMRIVVTTGSVSVFGDAIERLLAMADDSYEFFFQESELEAFVKGNDYRYQLTLDNQCFSLSWDGDIPPFGENSDNCQVDK